MHREHFREAECVAQRVRRKIKGNLEIVTKVVILIVVILITVIIEMLVVVTILIINRNSSKIKKE